MNKKIGKMVLVTAMCSVLMLGSSMTVFAGGGEDVEEPITEPIYTEQIEAESTEELETEDPVAFTPDGNAQLVDEATDEDEKLFYTFVTKNDNYFYLVIDKAREQDNVYMLNMIEEDDLLDLIEEQKSEGSVSTGTTESQVSLKTESGVTEETEPESTEPDNKDETESKDNKGNGASSIVIVLLVLLGGGAAAFYYLKVVKGKKENFNMEDDLDFYDDEEYENEDTQEESEEQEADESEPVIEEETGEIEEDV